LLNLAPVYRAFQRAACGDAARRIAQRHLRAEPGQRVLDIGCGPGTSLDYLPGVEYLGIDPSQRYIAAARRWHGERGRFICQRVGNVDVEELGSFDLVFAQGVVHHLDNQEAQHLYQLARQTLNPNGRLVTIDPCFASSQTAMSRMLVSWDRGRYVRHCKQYEQLARQEFSVVKAQISHSLLRIPYTHVIVECRQQLGSQLPRAA
jgi:SAM-dependent methyltransferase